MGCACETIAGDTIKLAAVCVGDLWMFQHLADAELQMLAGNARRTQHARGDTIFRQGDTSIEMFLLKGGRVKLSKILENGSEITLDIRKAGDFIGENMLADEVPYPVNAICLEETLTCGFSKAQFESLVLQYPNIGLQVIRNMSERISQLTSKVGSMATTSVEERLLSILRHIAAEHGASTPDGRQIQFPLTHEELSFLTGAHRVSITRAMKDLKMKGSIRDNGRLLIIPAIETISPQSAVL